MAIAGKVSIVPRGEWQSTEVYTRLDLVTFNYNVYLALKESAGIEPTNEEYFMLLIENVVAGNLEDLQNQIDDIILGEISVGNSDNSNNLSNQPSSYYATAQSVEDIVSGATSAGNANAVNGVTVYKTFSEINPDFTQDTPLLDVIKAMNLYSKLIVTVFDSNTGIYPARNGVLEIERTGESNFETLNFTGLSNDIKYHAKGQSALDFISGWHTPDGGNAASLGGETAEEWQNKLDNIQTTSKCILSAAGWYRVAEYATSSTDISYGANANGCELTIKRSYGNSEPEVHKLLVLSLYHNQSIYSLYSKTMSYLLQKVRYVVDENTNTAYIEVYYVVDKSNSVNVTVANCNYGNTQWKAITPTLTEETVEGVTVSCEYDIPANAKPVTDLDIAESLANHTPTYYKGVSESEIDQIYDDLHNNALNFSHYEAVVFHDVVHSKLGGNTWYVSGFRQREEYGVQIITTYNYDTITRCYIRSMYNYEWHEWTRIATKTDLANYLPLVGGEAKNFKIKGDTQSYITYIENNGTPHGYLGFNGVNNPVFIENNGANIHKFLHTGNKPTGTYTGNGDATERIINIGGIGAGVFIYGNNTMAVVSEGSLSPSGNLTADKVRTAEGTTADVRLILKTDHVSLNASGVEYRYWVL